MPETQSCCQVEPQFDTIAPAQDTAGGFGGEVRFKQIGQYPILYEIGRGGQGVVYRSVHPSLGRDLAIKVSSEPIRLDDPTWDLLVREGRTLAELEHPNLVRVFDLGMHHDQPYLVFEYVPGRSLDQLVAERPLPPRDAALLVARLARAVAFAHRKGIVHLDIKPQNVLVGEDDQPRLLDFGLARLCRPWETPPESGCVAGSAPYMAPEQAWGDTEHTGQATDVFGLGGLLYFLLVGRAPYHGNSLTEILHKACDCEWDSEPLRRSAPPQLADLCERALQARPVDRPASAEAMADELERFARAPWWSGWPWLPAGLGLLLVAVLGLHFLPRQPGTSRSEKSEEQQVASQKAVVAVSPHLDVRAFRGGVRRSLLGAAPLQSGDRLEVWFDLPPGLHATLFACSPTGETRRLASWTPMPQTRSLRYPERASEVVPLEGPTGTEILLLCGRAAQPVEEAAVRAALGEEPWSVLPEATVLRVEHERVFEVQRGRDLGGPQQSANPAGDVRQRLESARRTLALRYECLSGMAFRHVPMEE